MKSKLPSHLKKYIVDQEPTKYTPVDQAVWRFVLRQLKTYLSENAHESYNDGLKITGITVEEIPSIDSISKNLSSFGWQAAPVSGFIPPSAFLELQALKVLPIASDMRTIDHLTYTPAPDIVHEAAGHAPMLANPEFRKYLEEYAVVARKAIINKKDLDLYEAIRDLSDIKEHPNATEKEISECQKKLDGIAKDMGEPSEAALLARMAWWTTEYGLIGHDRPRIYGAGLLSSAGEGKSALSAKTQKIPFSIDCIKYSYDITEPQPQLFVASDFQVLSRVLAEFSETMAYKRGGLYGLQVAEKAKTVNTIEFDSGLQIGGLLVNTLIEKDQPIYLQFSGPCQLAYNEKEIKNQGKLRHMQGFGCPVGKIKAKTTTGSKTKINWESGVALEGELIGTHTVDEKDLILTFKNCNVTYKEKVLFDPSWGEYDLALGEAVTSVFGGAADKEAYGEFEDFSNKRIPEKKYTEKQKELFQIYQKVRDLRNSKANADELKKVLDILDKKFTDDWLLKLEIYELGFQLKQKPEWIDRVENELRSMAQKDHDVGPFILEGLKLAPQLQI